MSLCLFFITSFYITLVFGSGNQLGNSNSNSNHFEQDSETFILREELNLQQVKFRQLEKSVEELNEKLELLSEKVDGLRGEIGEDHGLWLLTPLLRGPRGPQGPKASQPLEFPSFCTTAQFRFRASSTTHGITYPRTGEYENYLDLCYIISSPLDTDAKVSLRVTRVETESYHDYLAIYKSANGTLIPFQNATLSGDLGSSLEEKFTSNPGESLLVRFHTDGSVTKSGFSLSFDTGNFSLETEDLSETTVENDSAGEATESSGSPLNFSELDFSDLGNCTTQFRLPASHGTQYIDYPASGQYENNLDLCYIITPPSNERVLVHVTKIQTEANYDYLKIFKPTKPTGALIQIQNYTGNLGSFLEEKFTSELGTPVVVYFHSDSSETKEGFSFSFETTQFPVERAPNYKFPAEVQPTTGAPDDYEYDHRD